jgi:hypothetical protein
LSKGRTILVIYLHVTAEENQNGETIFSVGMYGSKDRAPEVWELGWIGEKSAMLHYPRKEMMDLGRRLVAAYNAKRIDILQAILTEDAILDLAEGGQIRSDAVYSALARVHEQKGLMKTCYVRFNDVVYSEAPYIEHECYINFSVNKQDKIDRIEMRPLDETYREMIVQDEILMSHPMDEVPLLQTVEFLSPSERSRFSMLLTFKNGEIRRYDAAGDLGSDSGRVEAAEIILLIKLHALLFAIVVYDGITCSLASRSGCGRHSQKRNASLSGFSMQPAAIFTLAWQRRIQFYAFCHVDCRSPTGCND